MFRQSPLLYFIIGLMITISDVVLAQIDNPKYNKLLADSLGGDDYGMKSYVFVILKTGTLKADKAKTDTLFQGHMDNIIRLADAGKLVVSGPLKKNDKAYRGIFILNVATIEEGKSLLENDPAIKAKLLEAEYFTWFGSSALPLYLKYHEQVEKKKY